MAGPYSPAGIQGKLVSGLSERISPTGYDNVLSVEDEGFGNLIGNDENNWKLAQALFSGDKDRMAQTIFEVFPEDQVTEIAEDENGYQYFMHRDFGRIYTEKPGLDMEDVGAGISKTMAYATGVGSSLIKTMISEGIVGGAIDLLGGGGIESWKKGVEDMFWGAAGYVVGRGASNIWDSLTDAQLNRAVNEFEDRFNVTVRDKEAFREQMGKSPDLDTVTPEAAEVISRGEMPLGRGQITNEADDIALQQQAEVTGQLDPLIDAQEESLRRFDQDLVPKEESSAKLVGDIRQRSDETLGEATRRYNLVEEAAQEGRKGYLQPGDFSVQDRVRAVIPDVVLSHLDQYPTLKSTLKNLGELDNKFAYIRRAREMTGDVGGVDVRDIRQYIKDIDNKITEKNLGTEEGRHMLALRGELNDWYNKAILEAQMHGDTEVITALKEATGLYSEWSRRFKGPEGQRDIQNIVGWALDGNREPEEIARMLIGSTWAFKPAAVRTAKWLRDTMGTDSDSYQALGEYALNNLLTSKTGTGDLGEQALRSRLKSVIDKDGSNHELFTVLLGKDQLDELAAAYRDVNQLIPQGMKRTKARRSSGTAEREQAFNMLAERYGWKGRVVAKVFGGMADKIGERELRSLTTPRQLPVDVGAPGWLVGGGTTAAGSNEMER